MASSGKHPPSEGQQYRTVISGLAPFIRDGAVEWDAFCDVANSVGATMQVRARLETAIAEAGLQLRGKPDQADEDLGPDVDLDPAEDSGVGSDAEAIAAGRLVMLADRRRARPENFILTAREEVGLALLLRGDTAQPLDAGDFGRLTGERREAATCLFLHNQRLVHSIAQKYAAAGMAYDDVVQHGAIGLIRAVELFDPNQGNKFSTYATFWVRQAITRGIANDARLIRLPVHMVERVRKVWATRDRLTVDGEAPRVHDLALACGLDDRQVLECLRIGPPDMVSLDLPVGDGGETTLGDLLNLVDRDASPAEKVDSALLRTQLHVVLATLPEREAGVISMRFGLQSGEPMTLDDIGRIYGVTRERIRQIEKKAMEKLRHPVRSDLLRPYLD